MEEGTLRGRRAELKELLAVVNRNVRGIGGSHWVRLCQVRPNVKGQGSKVKVKDQDQMSKVTVGEAGQG